MQQRNIAPVRTAPEVIEEPLSAEELGARYRALCEDRLYANIPGKIEIDLWGRLVMSPASNYHSALQTRLAQRLAALGGQVFVEGSVVTAAGVFVPDVAWASAEFIKARAFETPYGRAPELCMEVVSPSNSRMELREKIAAYLETGAKEVWIVYPKSKRCEFHGPDGVMERSSYSVDLTGLFDDPA
jgi:Uma2 family endonuclease